MTGGEAGCRLNPLEGFRQATHGGGGHDEGLNINLRGRTMKGILLWLIGIPIPIILLLWLFGVL